MAEWTSYHYADIAETVDRDGKMAWVDPNNAKASDDDIAANVMGKDEYGDWLRLTDFDFLIGEIPDGSTINGIEVVIERRGTVADTLQDSALYLYYNGSARGDNKASAIYYPTSDTEKDYGGASALWGYAWDDSYIRSSTFGVQLSAYNDGSMTGAAAVDCIKIRVNYTPGTIFVSPDPVDAQCSIIAPTVICSSIITTPTPVGTVGQVVAPQVILGSTDISPPFVSSICVIVAPSVVHGSISLSPSPANAVAQAVDPYMMLGSTSAQPTPISVIAALVAPVVISSSTSVTPNPASVLVQVVAPTVGGGTLTIIPSPASAIVSVVTPTVTKQAPYILVQRGLVSLEHPDLEEEVTLDTPVLVGKSFVIATCRASDSPCNRAMAEVYLMGITNDCYTKIKVIRDSTYAGQNCYVEWQVITGDCFTVQSGETVFDDITIPKTEAINSVDLSKSFIVLTSASNYHYAAFSFVRARFTSPTEISLRPYAINVSRYPTVYWYVVEWEGATVQSGTIDITANDTDSISEVNLAQSFLIFSYCASRATNPHEVFVRGKFNSSIELAFDRGYNGGTAYISWFVVSVPSISVQPALLEVTPLVSSADDTLATSVDIEKTFLPAPCVGNGYSDSDEINYLHRCYHTHKLWQDGSDTKVTLARGTTGGTIYGSYFAVTLAAIAISPSPAEALGAVVTPSVVHGSLIVSPGSVDAIAQVEQPVVEAGDIIFNPGFVKAVGQINPPVVVLGSQIISPSEETKFEYYSEAHASAAGIYDSIYYAQTFTPSISHVSTKVKLLLHRIGSPGTVIVSIQGVDVSDHPDNNDLCSGTTDGDTLTDDSEGEWREIVLGDAGLFEGTKYAIVVKALGGDSSNRLNWKRDAFEPTYEGGCQESTGSHGGTWNSFFGYDFIFEEWGVATLRAVSVLAAVEPPTLIITSMTVTPTFVHALCKVEPPVVGTTGGTIYVTPDPADAVCAKVDPTVLLGSTTATPTPSDTIGSVEPPIVVLGNIIFNPGFIKAFAQVNPPVVIEGDIIIKTLIANTLAKGIDPTVVLSSLTLTPTFAKAVAGVTQPTVLLTLEGHRYRMRISTVPRNTLEIQTKTYHDVELLTKTYHNTKIWIGGSDMTERRDWQRGETVPIWAEVRLESTGALNSPSEGLLLYLFDPDGKVLATVDGEDMDEDSTGMYVYYWASPVDADVGWYRTDVKAQDGVGASAKITIEHGGFNLQT